MPQQAIRLYLPLRSLWRRLIHGVAGFRAIFRRTDPAHNGEQNSPPESPFPATPQTASWEEQRLFLQELTPPIDFDAVDEDELPAEAPNV
ncbi:uncharacterized protein ARMOST_06532 [Armillaria ostoyae]|uniref:Uncharacterized protein n=1 Tax=Armillaria ostoyae TaxID=47428 RepID=A0A284R395_ARMOS|nr:uncharacterized protein ARMOST_06532 [Armillaria ostoyae]